MTLAPGTQLGPYQIVSQLGQGDQETLDSRAHGPRQDELWWTIPTERCAAVADTFRGFT